jgi:hypothetical protein
MPLLKITAEEDCLVNTQQEFVFYDGELPVDIVVSYVGDTGLRVAFWEFYHEDGTPYLKISYGEAYLFDKPGIYYVKPIFE